MGIADELAAFLQSLEGVPTVWGETDCSATPWRWLRARGISASLPAYASREEARAIVARHGDLVATWDACLDGSGVGERFGDPHLGDIAVIDTRLHWQIGGIVAHGGILAIRKDDGHFAWFGPVRRFEKVWAIA